ncbi:MAG: hypothetical protein RIG62_09200 [Cyclobacteriaceae bacterium]
MTRFSGFGSTSCLAPDQTLAKKEWVLVDADQAMGMINHYLTGFIGRYILS